MSSFPHDPDDGTSIEFQNWWTAKRAEIETLPPIDLYEALKKAAFSHDLEAPLTISARQADLNQ